MSGSTKWVVGGLSLAALAAAGYMALTFGKAANEVAQVAHHVNAGIEHVEADKCKIKNGLKHDAAAVKRDAAEIKDRLLHRPERPVEPPSATPMPTPSC